MFGSFRRVRRGVAVALTGAALAGGAGWAWAGGYGLPGGPATGGGAPGTAPAIAAPVGGAMMTNDDLVKMLQNLGYEVDAKKNDKGAPYNLVKIDRNGWTFNPNISFSQDGKFLWLSTPLAELPKDAPADKLVAMLQKNAEFGPSHFSFRPAAGKIYFSALLANQGITPKALREKIEEFCDDVRNTEPLWNPKKWEPAAGGATTPPAK